ncbi:uncharacterized protein BDZ83DRAFT_158860 [Colletotrichum acutatum]|uniref:Uncharacterized protein n=1 Tax=Glomerella acutata TaxID=27357 RepID=A0AAD8XQ28_GLOAC|nr:uncharacterized protein BDZ83DRAFT_158860 [Colletotrichum acutatum]KAK1731416.1 hypothetical protein BDZ83DRAFT_158860 [Colletotrichum acutatum]
MGGITTAAVSLSAARLCLATGGLLSVDATLYGIVGHFSFSFFFSFFSSGSRGELRGWRKLCLAEAGWGNFRRGRGKVLFQHESMTFSRLGQAHLFLEWTVMISFNSRINEETETSRDHSVRSRTRNLSLRCSARKCLLGSFSP